MRAFLRLLLGGAMFLAQVGVGRAVSIEVFTNVDGMRTDLGSLNVNIENTLANPKNNPASAARIIGMFNETAAGAKLDQWYDFRWVNVETGYSVNGMAQTTDPVVGKLPAIDPQPGPKEDNIPYYYNNATEWNKAGTTFANYPIHQEGVASTFVDRPSDGTKNSVINFTTYLVVDQVSMQTFATKTTFDVIGGFSWTYTNNGNSANGTTAIGGAFQGLITDNSTDQINTAIGNAGNGGFPNWKAGHDLPLAYCPEPASILLPVPASLTLTGAWRRKRSNSVAA